MLSLSVQLLDALSLSWTLRTQEEEVKAHAFNVSLDVTLSYLLYSLFNIFESIFYSNIRLNFSCQCLHDLPFAPGSEYFDFTVFLAPGTYNVFPNFKVVQFTSLLFFQSLLCRLSSLRQTSKFGIPQGSGLLLPLSFLYTLI